MPNAGEDVEDWDHSITAGGDLNVTAILKRICQFLMKLNMFAIQPSNYTLGYLSQRNKNLTFTRKSVHERS